MSVTVEQIEEALKTLHTGAVISTLRPTVASVAAPVYLDFPDPELAPHKVYPSISILFVGMEPDTEVIDSEYERKVSENTGSVPYESSMSAEEIPFRISFQVQTLALDAQADRKLVQWVATRTQDRDSLDLGGGVFCWLFRSGMVKLDTQEASGVVYRKSWTLEVAAALDDLAAFRIEKQVHEVRTELGVVDTALVTTEGDLSRAERLNTGANAATHGQAQVLPVDADGNATTAILAGFTRDRITAFDDSDFWVP